MTAYAVEVTWSKDCDAAVNSVEGHRYHQGSAPRKRMPESSVPEALPGSRHLSKCSVGLWWGITRGRISILERGEGGAEAGCHVAVLGVFEHIPMQHSDSDSTLHRWTCRCFGDLF